jgi:hypothetical protein
MTTTVQARTARKPHRCEDCGRLIPAGHRYLRHVAFPDDAVNPSARPLAQVECVACAGERDDFNPILLADACASYCCGLTPCALPLRHGGDHGCRDCSTV